MEERYKIVEGVASVWHYHLSVTGKNGQPALCGKREMMHTSIPLSGWGQPGGHIPSSYCKECHAIASEPLNMGDLVVEREICHPYFWLVKRDGKIIDRDQYLNDIHTRVADGSYK